MGFQAPEYAIAALGVLVLVVFAAIRFFRWMFSGPLTPDPWDEAVSASVQDEASRPVCHRCFTEHAETACFCARCGAAVGEYNNYLPFEYLFSEGEVLRNGTSLRLRPGIFVLGGYLLLSLVAYAPVIFLAPIYWFFLIRNFLQPPPIEPPPVPGVAAA